jgi:hypothetical protein
MKGLITLTSQLKKAQEPTRDPDAPETRGRKAKSAEFDLPEDPEMMDFGDFEDLDLGDIGALEENTNTMNKIMNEISLDTVTAAISTAVERGETKRAEQLANTFFRNFVGKDFGEPLGALENIKLKANFEGNKAMGFIADFSNMRTRINYGADIDSLVYSQDGGAILDISKLPLDRKAVRNLQQMIKVVNPESRLTTGTSGFNVAGLREMTNLEKYIKQVIREAKNPLAQKMKEIENQGRVAALETKLAAIAEMIEETEGRLSRIDEDNEFRDMMDKNAVKEVRKQLKELERAQAKLQKEYAKAQGKGGKKKEVVDEVGLEEDTFELNESVKRMQKLANLKD